ncbi:type II CRISPR RNA-guided endonuclease Cas9 [Mannheimia indoligenes]|uniref:type II CRISPR RNA-guided endonuclease Cas9 n=1 Tax=Mannheimia indoligenes TaxID=3103145 RepID=UPI002FE5520A
MKPLHYILGLDLGIASVGWSVVEIDEQENPKRLIDVGVRTFDKAEVAKTGESLALARRLARSTRRLIRRRAFRLLKGKRLLKQHNVINKEELTTLPTDCWELRVKGLDERLSPTEWSAVLLHLLKHRGYLSQRKNEAKSADKEMGALLSGVNSNHQLLVENQFRTPAEIAVKKFALEEGHIRNQRGAYTHTFNRLDLLAEMKLLFQTQRELGNPHTSGQLEQEFCELLMWQKPALSRSQMLSIVGQCTNIKQEKRASKHTYSAERFIWLNTLNNLRILNNGEERKLNEQEKRTLINLPYEIEKLTYKQVRKYLGLSSEDKFKGLPYDTNNTENRLLANMVGFHSIKKALSNHNQDHLWNTIKDNPEKLDKLATEIVLCKNFDEFHSQMNHFFDMGTLRILFDVLSFDNFIQLSLLSLKDVIPELEKGRDYETVRKEFYPNSYQPNLALPNINPDEIRNPVVLRSLTQARKVINAVIRLYGSPARIHIETARELGKSYKDRKEIEKRQEQNRAEREKATAQFKTLFPTFIGEPKGKDILMMRLYEQQNGQCLYSGKPLNLNRLLEKGYVEIDHALPFSRTWDDSQNNKVLVLAGENQNKGNQTPFEWLGKDEHQWALLVARVNGCRFPYAKKQRILTKKLDEQGFIERNLNDTRYIARFLVNFVRENLHLTGKGKNRVFASNGQITAFLRGRWGLSKVREESDRHHALDAVVVACSTIAMQQKITRFVKYQEGNLQTAERIDRETGEIIPLHFPDPWHFFRQEVMIRIFSENPQEDLIIQLPDRPEANHEFVQPLFVSRMPTRKMSGQGHKETISSAKYQDENLTTTKKLLTEITLQDLENMINKDRDWVLYQSLKERLSAYQDNAKEAFKEKFYKTDKDGNKSSTIVKSIKITTKLKRGITIRDGIAENTSIVRTDLFLKGNKYYFVPVYAWQVAKGILPNISSTGIEIDDSYVFQFSLFKNDLIEIQDPSNSDNNIIAYYIRNGDDKRFVLKLHDGAICPNGYSKMKDNPEQFRISVLNQKSIRKYQVDELGKNIRPCRPSKRQAVR